MNTIFGKLSLDRNVLHWEDTCRVDSPVEKHGSLFFKREDYFAPLGYGGVNGAKIRQMLWLVQRYLETSPKRPGLLYAGSVKSPQLGRVSAVAKHFGIPCTLVIPSKLESAYKNKKNYNVIIAANLGANFHTAAAPYNPVLQATVKKLKESPALSDHLLLEYGLSVDGTPERIESFYRFCSEQVRTIPDDVDTLLMPAGSCNTTLSVLYGIARNRPKKLKRILLFGIAPTRIEWYEDRLQLLEKQGDLPVASIFRRVYHQHPHLSAHYGSNRIAPYELQHFDLFASKFTDWNEAMVASWGSIHLHPNYEAKMLVYMQRNASTFQPYLTSGRSLFWIVGSEPTWNAMAANVGRSDQL